MNADAVTLGSGPDLRPRTADGWGAGAALALGIHLMLVAALALGVRWKMSNPEVIEAEVWAEIPRAAVPDVAPPPPPPPLEQAKTETPPVEKPPEPEKAAEPEPPVPQPIPDVVVAPTPKKEPKKEPKKRKQREPVEVFETDPPKVSKKAKPDPKPEPKPEPRPDSKKATPASKPVASKVTGTDTASKAAAEREAQRQANLQRMMSDLGSLGTPSRSAGPSAAYGGRIKARIKPNILFTDSVSGNPLAVVEVRCGPDGRIIARKLIEPSGVASWDDAVLRAIDRTEVLPADESGRVPSVMQIEFRPKDF